MTYTEIAEECSIEQIASMLRALDNIASATGDRPGHVAYLSKEEMRACATAAIPEFEPTETAQGLIPIPDGYAEA